MTPKTLPTLVALLGLTGALACENLPGTREQQGAVIGGAAGSAVGAAASPENRLLGALIGGALGAGGGYLIGARTDWFDDPDAEREARAAVATAQTSPATVEDVFTARTADLNDDGFVTTDELIAMERANLTDEQILERLRATNQVFDLSPSQEASLMRAGVSPRVVTQMQELNRVQRDRVLGRPR